jgi:hypothetical protein
MFLHCHCEPEGRGNLFLYMRLWSLFRAKQGIFFIPRHDILSYALVLVPLEGDLK